MHLHVLCRLNLEHAPTFTKQTPSCTVVCSFRRVYGNDGTHRRRTIRGEREECRPLFSGRCSRTPPPHYLWLSVASTNRACTSAQTTYVRRARAHHLARSRCGCTTGFLEVRHCITNSAVTCDATGSREPCMAALSRGNVVYFDKTHGISFGPQI
jgi:hypothetical protein